MSHVHIRVVSGTPVVSSFPYAGSLLAGLVTTIVKIDNSKSPLPAEVKVVR